jgi:hypothetical protein
MNVPFNDKEEDANLLATRNGNSYVCELGVIKMLTTLEEHISITSHAPELS